MGRITNIGVQNFRIFKDHTDFELSPITILTGPNSSGKSSIFKSLLLLKDNCSINSLWKLDFSGGIHRLGTFTSSKNKNATKDELIKFSVEFEIALDENQKRRVYPPIIRKVPYTSIRGVKFIPHETLSKTKDYVGIELHYAQEGDNGKLVKLYFYNPETDETLIEIIISPTPDKDHKIHFHPELIHKSKYLKEIIENDFYYFRNNNRISKEIKEGGFELLISPYLPSIDLDKKIYTDDFAKVLEGFDQEISKLIGEKNTFFIRGLLRDILNPLLSILEYFEYIEAFRANTRRIYTNDSQGTSFNDLLREFSARKPSKEGINFINKWLKKFKIGNELIFHRVEGVANAVYLKTKNEKILLADLGFGITQFLPILMNISLEQPLQERYTREKPIRKLILLEEPETNLHPKLQSLIADMLIDATKSFAVNFIIETHSEYLIRKLQYFTVKKDINKDFTKIYYIYDLDEKPEKKEHVEEIFIDEDGGLVGEFGQGFFDEINTIISKIWEVR